MNLFYSGLKTEMKKVKRKGMDEDKKVRLFSGMKEGIAANTGIVRQRV